MSSAGTTLAAAHQRGLWTSYDSGATCPPTLHSWSDLRDIAMSDDGYTMAAGRSFQPTPPPSDSGYSRPCRMVLSTTPVAAKNDDRGQTTMP